MLLSMISRIARNGSQAHESRATTFLHKPLQLLRLLRRNQLLQRPSLQKTVIPKLEARNDGLHFALPTVSIYLSFPSKNLNHHDTKHEQAKETRK